MSMGQQYLLRGGLVITHYRNAYCEKLLRGYLNAVLLPLECLMFCGADVHDSGVGVTRGAGDDGIC